MAESFRNFTATVTTSSSSTTSSVIIPSGSSSSSTSRDAGSVAQVHSIYISQVTSSKYRGLQRYNPKNFNAFNLYIKNGNTKTYIVYDGRIVPGSPFFIEKNITLEATQELWIECPNDSYDYDMDNLSTTTTPLNGNGATLHITASAVLFPDANL